MQNINRQIEPQIVAALAAQKVILLVGARRTGKTVLLKKIAAAYPEPYLMLNGEDFAVHELFARRTAQNYRQWLGQNKLLVIDEAQKIPDIGNSLKLIVDEIPGVCVMVTGSSAFDLSKMAGEPLTGRKTTFHLFPFCEAELRANESITSQKDNLNQRLIYGNYPDVVLADSHSKKADYLKELVNDYLLKDILAFENLRRSDKILQLLRLLAYQVGKEVSSNELGAQLGMSKNTVDKYLDLLSKVFVIFKIGGYSRNLRKEISKSPRWYFHDNGILNTLLANFNALGLRTDQGLLWENYTIGERIKRQHYERWLVNNYFWRTYDQQEIDWVEEMGGKLSAFEMKWNPNKRPTAPIAWTESYPDAGFKVVTPDDYIDFVG